MKIWWHKLTHWEYWSTKLIYFPSFLFWIFNAIRLRHLSFFKYANPGMKNGGLFGDSKFLMYESIPPKYYPKTALLKIEEHPNLSKLIAEKCIEFPLILKPDTGFRGNGVAIVKEVREINEYRTKNKVDLLIQELIAYPNELSLFYYRLPNEKFGKISGITLKQFLTVVGDGESTIENLLKKQPRNTIQIKRLHKVLDLQKVLAQGEEKCLVPFGNHSLGTKFVDGSHLISDEMTKTFDSILRHIPGFFYGRLDIRYESIEALTIGEKFSIIEVNGAKSEPTHIYDPKYSFWQGQKEIFKHQRIFYQIAAQNLRRTKMGVDR